MILLLGGLAAMLSPCRAQNEPPWIELHGETGAEDVRLAWTLNGWREGVTGFLVRKRTRPPGGPPADWLPAQEGVIRPGMSAEKDLASVESDAAQRARLQAKFGALLARGEVKAVSLEEFVGTLSDPPEGFFGGLRRELATDHDRALFLGLGCTDRTVRGEEVIEYGVFPVRGVQVADEPAATHESILFRDGDSRLQAQQVAVDGATGGVKLVWNLPEEEVVRRWSIYAFRVYRRETEEGEFSRLTGQPLGSSQVTEGWRRWTYSDRSAEEGRDYTYRLVPVSFFQNELPAATQVEWKARPAWLQQARINLSSAEPTPEGAVKLAWELTLPEGADATGIAVERALLPEREMKLVTTLPPGTRTFLDRGPGQPDAAIAYRVTLMRGDTPLLNSNAQIVVYSPAPPPPAPTGLTARWLMLGEENFIHLKWDAKGNDDERTHGYRVFLDKTTPGELALQGSVPEIPAAEQEYLLPVDGAMSRRYRVGLAASAQGGVRSEVVATDCFVPGRNVPPVTQLSATKRGEGVLLRWQYDLEEGIYGYRIAVNGQPAASEVQLKPTLREWLAGPLEARTAYRFEVRAVGINGRLSAPAVATYSGTEQPVTGAIGTPREFQARWGDSGREIELSWNAPPESGGSYFLASDEGDLGVMGKRLAIEVDAPGHFRFPVADPNRSYRFRLWTRGPDAPGSTSSTGIHAEVCCLAPGRTLPPVSLNPIRPKRDADGRTSLELSWSYPEAPTLVGFRVYANAECIADEHRLGPGYRSFVVGPDRIRGTTRFELEAVGDNDEFSERGPERVWRFGG